MSQDAADEIRRAVLDMCNNLLPELNTIGAQQLERFAPASEDKGAPIGGDLLAQRGLADNGAEDRHSKASTELKKDQTAKGNHSSQSQSSGKPSGTSKGPSPAEIRGGIVGRPLEGVL